MGWADRLYSYMAPVPSGCNPIFGIDEALDAYRRVLQVYPRSRANIGIGNCLMLLGHFSDAAAAYGQDRRSQEARRREALVGALRPLANSQSVMQVVPIPGQPNRWIAMFGTVKPSSGKTEDWRPPDISGIALADSKFVNGKATRIGKIADASGGRDCLGASLFVTMLSWRREPVALVYRDSGGADHDSNDQPLYAIRPGGLRSVGRFWGEAPTAIYPATTGHGLFVKTTSTWKVWWPNVYDRQNRSRRMARVAALHRPTSAPSHPLPATVNPAHCLNVL